MIIVNIMIMIIVNIVIMIMIIVNIMIMNIVKIMVMMIVNIIIMIIVNNIIIDDDDDVNRSIQRQLYRLVGVWDDDVFPVYSRHAHTGHWSG